MKIKIDENLPWQIGALLKIRGHEVHAAGEEGLSGCTDEKLWATVQREGRFLVTQDLDFSDARRFAPGTHYGILLIRLHSPSRSSLIRRMDEILHSEDVNQWARCFVVASEHKLRVRLPANP